MRELTPENFLSLLETFATGLKLDEEDLQAFRHKMTKIIEQRKGLTWEKLLPISAMNANGYVSKDFPDWQFLSARLHLQELYLESAKNRGHDGSTPYGPFEKLIEILEEKGIYTHKLRKKYTKQEIKQLAEIINPMMDYQYNYLGLVLVGERYLARDHSKNLFELPQERNLIISMTLMQDEKRTERLKHVKSMYWNLSNTYQTVATPTMKNAGLTYGQLSSCFVDTVEDSLDGIYLDNWDVARLSKDGGGIGVYFGKIRSRGSSIKDFLDASSGQLPWMKQLNNTAVSVDQLGQRQGAIAIYTDVWHKDVEMFIDARLNNGDERLRTHDISLGLCVPDIFMEKVEAREMWYLFDPHEIRKVMGYSLEDCYDEELGKGTFRTRYQECVDNEKLSRKEIPAIDLMFNMLRSQKETGYEFMFYRDEVNRANPNKHAGMIYCSNLCTEIAQNMSPTIIVEEKNFKANGKDYTSIIREHGDFVVCNLAAINLAKAIRDGVLEEIIPTIVRGLDNVIELNNITVGQAQSTNAKYRGIGLGTFGWHHHLAISGIKWESEEAVRESDRIYEEIAYLTIKASHELALEKGAYPEFPGSEWNTGEYFVRRGYVARNAEGYIVPVEGKERWFDLCMRVVSGGIRNGYLMAVAPNMSTAKAGGSTDGIDPVFDRVYAEEKKNYKIPTTVPDLNSATFFFYKNGFLIDQSWTIKQNAARQRHVDQAVSMNLYIPQEATARDILDLHMQGWKSGLKTSYYIRSQSEEQQDPLSCDACQ